MRIRRQAAAGLKLAAEILEVCFVDAPLEVRTRIHARRGVALEEDDVRVAFTVVASKKMIEPDFIKRGRRGVGGDVSADAILSFVGPDDHRRRIPPDQTLDAPFEIR